MTQQIFHHFIMFEIRINGWSPHLYSYLFKKYFLSIDDCYSIGDNVIRACSFMF